MAFLRFTENTRDEVWGTLEWCTDGLREYFREEVGPRTPRRALLKLCSLLHDIGKPETKSFEAGGRMLAKPAQVLFAVGGVDNHEEALLAVVDDEVVDDAALLVEQQVVLRLAEADLRQVIGDEVLEELERVTRDPEPAHVGDVEQPGHVANGEVLVADRGVLLRHLPAAKIDHPAAEGEVAVVKRRAVRRVYSSSTISSASTASGSMKARSSSS